MPLLSDATKLFVGTTPITKVYAGTKSVWPVLNPEVEQYASGAAWGPDRLYWLAVLQTDIPADCAIANSQYSYRTKGAAIGDNWSTWYSWAQQSYIQWSTGYISNDSGGCELYLSSPQPISLAIEFRRIVNGTTYTKLLDHGEIKDKSSLPIYDPQPTLRVRICAYRPN